MRVLLVVPTIPELRPRFGRPVGHRVFRVPFAGLLTVATILAQEHDVTLIDEHVEEVDLETNCDLVGFTVAAATAPRAAVLAKQFRARGIPAFAGGFHPTFDPAGCLAHFDALVVGEAEGVVERLVRDAAAGRLERVYQRPEPCDPSAILPLRRDLVRQPGEYFTINVITATRGCPYRCDFCGVRAFHRDIYRTRPLASVLGELQSMQGRRVLFTDDNLIGDREYAKALFREMVPLRKWWLAQMSIDCARDPELLDLAGRAGCLGVFIGFETLSATNLAQQGKRQNVRQDYGEVIDTLHRHGIAVAAGTMFGFDDDDRSVFDHTVEFFLERGLDCMQVDPLTPFPGTELYRKLDAEGRITTRELERYNIGSTVFRPRGMTAEELEVGLRRVRARFYSLPQVVRRTLRLFCRRPVAGAVFGTLNWAYHRHLRLEIGYPP